jgi:CRISPR/Cas system-associated exonuclease Cas4 (RecB family)
MNADLIVKAREAYLAGDLPSPDEVRCVCGGERDGHSGVRRLGGCASTGCARYRPDPVLALAVRAATAERTSLGDDLRLHSKRTRRVVKRKAAGEVSVRPSDVGECRRAVYYRETPPEDFTSSPTNSRAAFMGGLIHAEVLRRRRQLYPWRLYGDMRGREVRFPGLDRPGKYDEYDPITGVVTDVKTAGQWKWERIGEDGPDEKWWDQLHLYGLALILAGYAVEKLRVLAIERADGRDETFEIPYDPARAQRVLASLQALSTMLDLGRVPPRDRSGPSTDALCRNCFARDYCWNTVQAEALGRSPESLTVLGIDPDDAVVEELAELLVAARHAEGDAKKRKDELAAILAGVDPRVYGEYEGVPGHNSRKAWEEWYELISELWLLSDDQRPTELPEVRVNRTEYVTWKPLRKATRERLAQERLEARVAAEKALEAEQEQETPRPVLRVVATREDGPPALLPS